MVTLLHNANIFTADGAGKRAKAAVILGKYFAYVGSESGAEAFVQGLGEGAVRALERVDAGGCFVMPGFNDSHMHYLHYVQANRSVDLTDSASMAETLQRLREGLKAMNAGAWLIGRGWNQELFQDEKRFPTAADLDKVSTDTPMLVMRTCYHAGVFNSRAMELMGLNAETVKKFGNLALALENGAPSGVFLESAFDLLKVLVPAADTEAAVRDALDAQADLFSLGITSVHSDDHNYIEPGQYENLLHLLRDAGEDGRLKLRIAQQALFFDKKGLEEFLSKGFDKSFGNNTFKLATVKLLADGSLGARTAYLNAPYRDDPSTRGIAMFTQEELNDIVLLAHAHDLPVAIHAIGDATIDMALNAIGAAQKAMPHLSPRHGIVHCQITTEAQIKRFKTLNVAAYTQPVFIDSDMRIVQSRVGELADTSYAWAAYLKAGVHQAFGTDCPVERMYPLWGVYAAHTRKARDGRGPYLPGQALSVEDCLYAYTAGGAYLSGDETIKGKIRAGHLADFILLDRDITAVEPEDILNAQVLKTYIGGECVWERP